MTRVRVSGVRREIGPAPRRPGDTQDRCLVECSCGKVDDVIARMFRAGHGRSCRSCASKSRIHLHQVAIEVLVLAAEHRVVTPPLIQAELGLTERAAQQVGLRLAKHKLFSRVRRGKYLLTPAGVTVLREIAEGKVPDRYKVRKQIEHALATREPVRETAA